MQSSEEKFDVLLVGLGAVGGLYAYILEKSGKCRVTAVARSLYGAINKHGITIKSQKFGEIRGWKPHRLTSTAEEAADRNYRFIICSFKCLPDVQPTSSILAPLMMPSLRPSEHRGVQRSPTVVLIQNGIGIEQPLAEAFPAVHIISCVSWIGANMITPLKGPGKPSCQQFSTSQSPGPVLVHGILEKLVFGLYEGEGFAPVYHPDPQSLTSRTCNQFVDGILSDDGTPLIGDARAERIRQGKLEVEALAHALRAGGGEAEVLEHIQPARWAKNLWNGAFSSMCALSRVPVSNLTAPEVLPYTLPVVRRVMLEIIYVARALGYRESDLPAEKVDEAIQLTIQHYKVDESKSTGATGLATSATSPEILKEDVFEEDHDDKESSIGGTPGACFKPSMLVDLEMERPLELEPIIGAVLDRARSKAIETPRLDLIYSALKVSQEKAVHAHAAKLKTQEHEEHLNRWAMRKPSIGGSGTSDSRQAWLAEVRRRAKLGNGTGNDLLPGSRLTSAMPTKDSKVDGKPLVS